MLAAIVFGERYEIPAVRASSVTVNPFDLARYAGRYEIAPGFVLTVRAGARGLFLAARMALFYLLTLKPRRVSSFARCTCRLHLRWVVVVVLLNSIGEETSKLEG